MSGQSTIAAPVPVLITRPEPQASRFAQMLAAAEPRARALIAPLMRTEDLTPPLPAGDFAALLLSSEPGALAAGRLGPGLPRLAHCVGPRTAEVAAAQGLTPGLVAPTAEALADALLAAPNEGPLLWLRGVDHRPVLPARLRAAGRAYVDLVVYRQAECPLSPAAQALLAQPGPRIVTLFSPRSAVLLAAALPPATLQGLQAVAISALAAEALPEPLRSQALIAETPDAEGMLSAIRRSISTLVP